jgi:hypothetical protein
MFRFSKDKTKAEYASTLLVLVEEVRKEMLEVAGED